MSELTANKTFYVRTDGDDDTNDGLTSGNAFRTPHRAAEETRKWRTGEFTITVDIGKGAYLTVLDTLNADHCDGRNVVWTGVVTEYTGIAIDNVYEEYVEPIDGLDQFRFDIHLPDATDLADEVGERTYVLVRNASGGTDPHLVNGCHQINQWDENTKMAKAVAHYNNKAGVLPSGSITANVTLVETSISFGNNNGIVSSSGLHCGNWDNMVLAAFGSAVGIWMSNGSAISLGPRLGTSRFGNPTLLCQSNAIIDADGSSHSVSHLKTLATADTGGTISLRGAILVGCSQEAVIARDNGTIDLQDAELYYTGYPHSVKATRCGSINAANCTVLGCAPTGSVAFYMDTEGYIDSTDATDDAETSRGPYTENEIVKVLDANKTIYVRTTGDDSNDGNSSDDAFLTPERVMAELHKWNTGPYTITVDIGEGTFNCANDLNPSRADGQSIQWDGAATAYTSRTINNIDGSPTALSAGLEYIDFDVSLPAASGASVGQYILVKTTTGGTYPNLVKGCHEIVAWNGTTNIATVRCVRGDSVTAMPSGAITASTLTLVKSVFHFSDSNGITENGALHCGTWDNMIFKGSLTYHGIRLLAGSTIVLGSNFGTSKWFINLRAQNKGNILADYSVHSYSDTYAVMLGDGSSGSLRHAILSGCKSLAILCSAASGLNFYRGQVYCAGIPCVMQADSGSSIFASRSVIEGCASTGSVAFYVTSGGGIDSSLAFTDAETPRDQEAAPGGNGSYHVY